MACLPSAPVRWITGVLGAEPSGVREKAALACKAQVMGWLRRACGARRFLLPLFFDALIRFGSVDIGFSGVDARW